MFTKTGIFIHKIVHQHNYAVYNTNNILDKINEHWMYSESCENTCNIYVYIYIYIYVGVVECRRHRAVSCVHLSPGVGEWECVYANACRRKRPTHARRGWSEGPEWGVWNAERSAEDKSKGGESDERELHSARRLIILRQVDVCREWRAYFVL